MHVVVVVVVVVVVAAAAAPTPTFFEANPRVCCAKGSAVPPSTNFNL